MAVNTPPGYGGSFVCFRGADRSVTVAEAQLGQHARATKLAGFSLFGEF